MLLLVPVRCNTLVGRHNANLPETVGMHIHLMLSHIQTTMAIINKTITLLQVVVAVVVLLLEVLLQVVCSLDKINLV